MNAIQGEKLQIMSVIGLPFSESIGGVDRFDASAQVWDCSQERHVPREIHKGRAVSSLDSSGQSAVRSLGHLDDDFHGPSVRRRGSRDPRETP